MINKVLIVGLGSIGKRHIEVVKKIIPESKIAIYRHKKSVHDDYKNYKIFYDLDKAISFKPNIALICNPSSIHLEVAKKLLLNNIHILVEKPLSDNLTNSIEFEKLAKKRQLKVQVGYNLRFLSSINLFKSLLEEGEIGEVLSFRSEVGSYLPNWRLQGDYREQVSARRELGGGVLLELSHEIDYLLWIFGKVDWVSSNISNQSKLEIDVEDNVNLIIGFKELKVLGSLNMDFYRRDSCREMIIIGTEGSLKWDGIRGSVSVYHKNGRWIDIRSFSEDLLTSYEIQLKNFINSIENDLATSVTIKDGIRVLEVVEASIKSNKLGKKVFLR